MLDGAASKHRMQSALKPTMVTLARSFKRERHSGAHGASSAFGVALLCTGINAAIGWTGVHMLYLLETKVDRHEDQVVQALR